MKKLLGYQKGVNLGGWLSQGSLEKTHLDAFITEKDIEAIASLGCDYVRLPVDYENIENADRNVTFPFSAIFISSHCSSRSYFTP